MTVPAAARRDSGPHLAAVFRRLVPRDPADPPPTRKQALTMNMKRMRGRNHRGSGGGGGGPIRHQTGNVPLNRNHVFDSSGPDLRVRGTSQQLFEKYLQLGRDATSAGDRVMAESYFQHAEHYFRILNAMNQASQAQGQAQGGQRRQHEGVSPEAPTGNEPQTSDYRGQPGVNDDDTDDEPPGLGDQPAAERDIPIAASPPDA